MSKLVDKNNTFQVRLDKGWQKILLQLRAETGDPIKSLVEDALSNVYGIDENGKPYNLLSLRETK